MPTLVLRFPGRRYHATPWGHHVNEGLIEWPPSPWRLLRALLSVGYTSLGWEAPMGEPWRSAPPPLARSLLLKLAAVLPLYALPPATGTHSRHYMPVGEFKSGTERKSLVFDTWAQIERGELAVRWDASLEPDEARLLGQLAERLGYLGRSESWVSARLADDADTDGFDFDCHAQDVQPLDPGWEQAAMLAPMAPSEYAKWLGDALQRALHDLPLPEGKRVSAALQKKRAGAQAPYPVDLLSCLQVDTTWLREHGWSQPPGSRRVLYRRRNDALSARFDPGRASPSETDRPSCVLLSLSSRSGNDHALPTLARSLPQGEMLHRQMVAARLRLAPDEHSQVLTGCDETGAALRGAHRHAHVLSLDLDEDGHIDHLMVWAPDGLDALDQRALRLTRGTHTKGGVGSLRLAWAGAGERDDFDRLAPPYGTALDRTLGRGRTWISATPFVPPRHLKTRGANTLEGQLRAELASRALPPAKTIEVCDPRHDDHARRLRHHVRVRRHGGAPPVNIGFTLQLTFAEDVHGPLCLGYGSHFGLGRFERVRGAD